MSNRNIPENIRDCVKRCIDNGARDKYEFRDMRHGIICELKRLGCSADVIEETMTEWNDRSYKKLSYKDFAQQILSYINWAFKKGDVKAGCNYFKERGHCITECQFMKRRIIKANADLSKEVIYTEDEMAKFLKQYDKCKHSRECAAIYKIIDRKRIEQGITRDGIVLMSFREIQKEYWRHGYSSAKPMDISRLINELKDSGLLEIPVKGKSGEFKGLANGYRLKVPEDVYDNDLKDYNDKEPANS